MTTTSPSTDARIAWAAGHLRRHLDRRIPITSLARAVQLSPSRFTHLFRNQTGVSPARYIQDLRLQRARVLLERTFLSVGDVMTLVGYHDPSHFSRDFKRRHGLPPSLIRDHNRATPLHGPGLEDGYGPMPEPAESAEYAAPPSPDGHSDHSDGDSLPGDGGDSLPGDGDGRPGDGDGRHGPGPHDRHFVTGKQRD